MRLRYDALSSLRMIRQEEEVKSGQVIFQPGLEKPIETRLYAVCTGKVRIEEQTLNGKTFLVQMARENELFGLESEGAADYRFSAIAGSKAAITYWTWPEVKAMIKGDDTHTAKPELELGLLELRAALGEQHLIRLREMSYKISCRLAMALIRDARNELAANRAIEVAGGVVGEIEMEPITHEVLASTVLTSREIVTHYMNDLRRIGLIEYSRKGIIVRTVELDRWWKNTLFPPREEAQQAVA